jgi:hypothetical protein
MAREELTIFKCLQVQLWYGTPGYGDNARMSNRRRNVEHFDRYFGRTPALRDARPGSRIFDRVYAFGLVSAHLDRRLDQLRERTRRTRAR